MEEVEGDKSTVTPLAGVWIEITSNIGTNLVALLSLPSRECGLKWKVENAVERKEIVTPLAGVWIEIIMPAGNLYDTSLMVSHAKMCYTPEFDTCEIKKWLQTQ